jgi:hypothetical protein
MPKIWEEGGKNNRTGQAEISQEPRRARAPSKIHRRGSTRAPYINGPRRSAPRPSACTAGHSGKDGELLFFQHEVFSAFLKALGASVARPGPCGMRILGDGERWRRAAPGRGALRICQGLGVRGSGKNVLPPRSAGLVQSVLSLRSFDHSVRSIVPFSRNSFETLVIFSPSAFTPCAWCPKPSTNPTNRTNRTNSTESNLFVSRTPCTLPYAPCPTCPERVEGCPMSRALHLASPSSPAQVAVSPDIMKKSFSAP